ncbi:MAG: NfeD family protein [Anaerolineales bacterium]|jgi:membrane-bound serine protease (ClpP class)
MEEILLDPNLIYLALVAGLIFAVMALLTPGTGVFEILALLALIYAGYGIVNSSVNYWALIFLLVAAVFFILAVRRRGQRIFLALSIIALLASSLFLFRGDEWWQPSVNPFLALIISTLAGAFLWIVTTKVLEAREAMPSHDLESIIGSIGEARSTIHAEGSVYANGELWTARSDQRILAGSRVRVIGREGFILEVEAIEEDQE